MTKNFLSFLTATLFYGIAGKNLRLVCEQRLADGSYLSRIYPSGQDRKRNRNGVVVRVIDYRLEGVPGVEPIYRLVTTILDPAKAPAPELAALYHERWEIETALDELKTHLWGARIVLRSKRPDLVSGKEIDDLRETVEMPDKNLFLTKSPHETPHRAD